jgi:hypothetical protein
MDGADNIQGLGGDDQLEAWGNGAAGAVSKCDVDTSTAVPETTGSSSPAVRPRTAGPTTTS